MFYKTSVFQAKLWKKLVVLFAFSLFSLLQGKAQEIEPATEKDSLPIPSSRSVLFWASSGAAGVTLYACLGFAWYQNLNLKQFQWYNDWNNWQQLDKVGHAYGAYQVSRFYMEALQKLGYQPRQILFWGSLSGFLWQAPIELFDGFSPRYGASYYDLVFNALGSGVAAANYALWKEQKILLKFSFFPSPFAQQAPALLGKGVSQVLKDYNGQTYWLSFPVYSKAKWLHWAVGMGGSGMVGGYGREGAEKIAQREMRKFFIGPDFRFSAIPTPKKYLKTFFFILDAIRLPLPTLEIDRKGARFWWFFF